MNEESVIEMRDALAVIMAESLKTQNTAVTTSSNSIFGGKLLTSTQNQQASQLAQSKLLVKQKEQSISYVISEALSGGILHDLYKSFSEEMWLDKVGEDIPCLRDRPPSS